MEKDKTDGIIAFLILGPLIFAIWFMVGLGTYLSLAGLFG